MSDNKKLAVVLGGWHYPYAYYNQMKKQIVPDGWEIDFFVVSHRDPELPVVFDEKQPLLEDRGDGFLQDFDKELYGRIITKDELSEMGFIYDVEESSIGDLFQLNQWVQRHYEGQYDKVLFSHDDNYLLNTELFTDILGQKAEIFMPDDKGNLNKVDDAFDWKHLAGGQIENTRCPRTSFTFLDRELLDELVSDLERIATADVDLIRTGETDTLYDINNSKQVSTDALVSWNSPGRSFVTWMRNNDFIDKSVRLSPYYRVTKYFIEGERGFMWTHRDEERTMNSLSSYYQID